MAAGKGAEDSKDANYDKEHADYYDLDKKLKTCEQDKNIIKAGKAPVKEIKDSDKTAPLKVNKPEIIKFSGQARDFATFKRDF